MYKVSDDHVANNNIAFCTVLLVPKMITYYYFRFVSAMLKMRKHGRPRNDLLCVGEMLNHIQSFTVV